MAGRWPHKISPETARAPAPGTESSESAAPAPHRLVTSPEQHPRDGEVGEAADAPRHQLQIGFRHGRVRVRGRTEAECQQATVISVLGTGAGCPPVGGASMAGCPGGEGSTVRDCRGRTGGERRGLCESGWEGGLSQEVAHLL